MRRALPIVILAALVCGVIAGAVSAFQPLRYDSSVTFVVRSNQSANETEMLLRTITALVPTELTGQGLAERSGVPRGATEIAEQLTTTRPPGSATIVVTYSDQDESVSRAVANHLVGEIADQVAQFGDSGAAASVPAALYSVVPWGQGAVTTEAVAAPVARNVLAGLLAGLLLGVLFYVVRAAWRPVVIDESDIPHVVDATLPQRMINSTDALNSLAQMLDVAGEEPVAARSYLVVGPVDSSARAHFAKALARSLGDAELESSAGSVGVPPSWQGWRTGGAQVIEGPRVPGSEPVRATAAEVSAVILLIEARRSLVSEVEQAFQILEGQRIFSVLVNAQDLRIAGPVA